MTTAENGLGKLLLLGCGKMGSALLKGWLHRGTPPEDVLVIDPAPPAWLEGTGVTVATRAPDPCGVLLVAVKPQMMDTALPQVTHLGGGATLVISVAAGVTLAQFEAAFGPGTPVVRAMPNLPAAVGRGVTAIVANAAAGAAGLATAESLLGAVGTVVRLDDEAEMDAVTGLAGSGPAYVFHLVEAMAAAGEAEGLSPETAMALARATVAGAGALLDADAAPAAQLRIDVTSPRGTTEAGLKVLMADLPDLMRRTVAAAADRSRELGR